jgi:hypothetical protein
MRVTRSRELVAEGHSPSVVARVAQISRQAIYRVPKTRPAATRSTPPADAVEAAIVEVAEANHAQLRATQSHTYAPNTTESRPT